MGVDPGSRVTGFGLIEVKNNQMKSISHGVIVLDEETFPERITALGEHFRQLLVKYQPHQVVLEKIFMGKNADSAFKLGHARGVLMYEAMRAKAQVFEYATRVVKKGITGNGGADKTQVQAVIQALLGIKKIDKIDASDALAMACYHAEFVRREMIMSQAQSTTQIYKPKKSAQGLDL